MLFFVEIRLLKETSPELSINLFCEVMVISSTVLFETFPFLVLEQPINRLSVSTSYQVSAIKRWTQQKVKSMLTSVQS